MTPLHRLIPSFRSINLATLTALLIFMLPACASDGTLDGGSPGLPAGPGAVEPAAQAAANGDADVVAKADEIAQDDSSDDDEEGDPDAIDDAMASVDHDSKTFTETDIAKDVGDEISHSKTQQIPLEINEDVQRWIEYFSKKDSERFGRFLERGEKYKATISAVLKDQGIPTEIYYQAMIESGFACNATSTASAVGIWQFVRETGRRYGLRVDGYVDERRDPLRATIAASLYMKDLYNVFQDWYLAMAAYNAGEGRILGAIMRAKTRDFWAMVKLKALPEETLNYIPKFLAATIIGHNPRQYGFADVSTEAMAPLASVAVPSPVRLSDVAAVSGIALDELKEANPNILRGITPPGVPTYRLWLPKDRVQAVQDQIEKLASMRLNIKSRDMIAANSAGGEGGKSSRVHTVARGETLAKIAGTYGLSVSSLKRLNNLHSSRVVKGQRLVLWASDGKTGRASVRVANAAHAAVKHYRVQRGDNLKLIAKRFNVSVNDIKKLNRLKRNTLYIGQIIKVNPQRI